MAYYSAYLGQIQQDQDQSPDNRRLQRISYAQSHVPDSWESEQELLGGAQTNDSRMPRVASCGRPASSQERRLGKADYYAYIPGTGAYPEVEYAPDESCQSPYSHKTDSSLQDYYNDASYGRLAMAGVPEEADSAAWGAHRALRSPVDASSMLYPIDEAADYVYSTSYDRAPSTEPTNVSYWPGAPRHEEYQPLIPQKYKTVPKFVILAMTKDNHNTFWKLIDYFGDNKEWPELCVTDRVFQTLCARHRVQETDVVSLPGFAPLWFFYLRWMDSDLYEKSVLDFFQSGKPLPTWKQLPAHYVDTFREHGLSEWQFTAKGPVR